MSRTTIIALCMAVLAAGIWVYGAADRSDPAGDLLVGVANAEEAVDISTVTEMQLGNPDAPVTVVEYASFTCPHCARFHATTFKKLKSDYIDTGKINFIYRDVYFDRYGLWASAVARCGGAEKFFGISDLIYADQAGWTGAGEPAAIADELRKIGRLAGLDGAQVEQCLQDGAKMKTLVAWYQENAERDGIRSTPSLMINGQLHQNMGYEELKELIDAALAG